MPKRWYIRGDTLWARVTIEGQEYRESLRRKASRTPEHVRDRVADEWAERIRAEVRGDAATRTFDEIGAFFVTERLPELRPRGAERYRLSLRNLLPHFEGKPLVEIDAPALRAFETARRADGVTSGTIRRDLQCLSAAIEFFGIAHDMEMDNPARRYLRRRAKQKALVEAPPRRRYLSHAEEARLLAVARAREAKDKRLRGLADAIAFAIDTGLRLDEQFSLRWPDVNMRTKRVTVRAEVAKSGKERVVPLLPRSAQILAQMPRRLRPAEDGDWVWGRADGERYPNRTKAFGSALTATGLKGVRWHDLRRTCGCRRLQDMGWSHAQVQKLLGHASVTTTEQIYAFLEVEHLEDDGTKSGTGTTDSESADA